MNCILINVLCVCNRPNIWGLQKCFSGTFMPFLKILSHCTFAKGTVMLVQWILTKVCLCNRKAIKQWDGVIYHQSNVLFEEDWFIDNDWWTYLLLHKCILRIITSSILLSYFNSGHSTNIRNKDDFIILGIRNWSFNNSICKKDVSAFERLHLKYCMLHVLIFNLSVPYCSLSWLVCCIWPIFSVLQFYCSLSSEGF